MNTLVDKAYGCLIAGLIGDAMGTPTEGKEPEAIEEIFGWVDDFEGDGTDDSMLKHFLCDALIQTRGYATADDWAETWVRNRSEIFGPKRGRFMISVLHTADKLSRGYLPRMASVGNMASSSSAMSIAPVGIVNAGHPQAASAQAQDLGSLIHTNDVSFCQDGAAAIAAAVAAGFAPGASVQSVLRAATDYIKPKSGHEMLGLIESALSLVRETGDYKAFRTAYHKNFRRERPSDSRETVPATLALVLLSDGHAAEAITFGANFGRDTDTIATMAGAICGALKGGDSLPSAWTKKMEKVSARNQRQLAEVLVEVALDKAAREVSAWTALVEQSASA